MVTFACPSLIDAPPVALDRLMMKVSVPSWSVSAKIGMFIVCCVIPGLNVSVPEVGV